MRLILLVTSLCCITGPVRAQSAWHLTAAIADARYGGTSIDTAEGDGSFRPSRSTMAELGVERGGRVRWGLAVRYGTALAAFDASDATVIARTDPLKLLELQAVVSLLVARIGPGQLRLDAGPVLDHWRWSAGDPRTRLGGRAGVGLEAPLGRRTHLTVHAGWALTGSVLEEADLPDNFARRRTSRTSVAAGFMIGP